jgi:hypothetical protein
MGMERDAARKEADVLLHTWERRTVLAVFSHARSANRCAAWDIRLGSASVILTAIVGTSVVATLQTEVDTPVRIGVGVLTVAAAASSAVHVFAGLPDRKAVYEQASRRHAVIRRRIEAVRARLATSGECSSIWDEVDSIEEDWSQRPHRVRMLPDGFGSR